MRFLRHPFSEEDLTAYVDGELSRAQDERLEAHLTSCDACASFVAGVLDIKASLGGLPEERTDRSFFWPGAGAATHGGRRPSRRLPVALAAAGVAAVLLVSGAFALFLSSRGGDSTPGNDVTAKGGAPTLETPAPAVVAPVPSPVAEPPATSLPSSAARVPTVLTAPTRQAPPALVPQLSPQPSQAPPTPPRQPTQAPQAALAAPTSPTSPTQQAVATPGGASAATLAAPAAPTTGTITVTPSGNVQVGKAVSLCFTTSRPVQTRILDQLAGQSAQVLLTDSGTDTGHCHGNLQVEPPLGTETFTLQYLEGANWVELAHTSITVVR